MADKRALPRWTVPVVATLVALATTAVLLALWWWVGDQNLTGKDLATARLDAVKVASGIAVGGGGLFALYLAARRQRTQELELDQRRWEHQHTIEDAAERRVTDLYAQAAEQLGSDKAPVRLAALHTLARLGDGNPSHRRTVLDLLCAYLRMPYDPPTDPTDDGHRERTQEREVRLTAQRIATARLRPTVGPWYSIPAPNPLHWPGEFDLDLSGATLLDFGLTGCVVRTGTFRGARFHGKTHIQDECKQVDLEGAIAELRHKGFARSPGSSYLGGHLWPTGGGRSWELVALDTPRPEVPAGWGILVGSFRVSPGPEQDQG
ncbi:MULTISPECIES: pentapeptide repeat-containing protein [unclassified Saccharothrix]|uniref:pentapeptide repeat-containing protein n=1 Tax=unclassified Saccharothrix TaxID=2593673 RepID=UPI00307CDCA3